MARAREEPFDVGFQDRNSETGSLEQAKKPPKKTVSNLTALPQGINGTETDLMTGYHLNRK